MQVDVAAVMVVYCKCGWRRVQPAMYADEEFLRHRQKCKGFYIRRRFVLVGMLQEPAFTRVSMVGVPRYDPMLHFRRPMASEEAWTEALRQPSFDIMWVQTLENRADERDGTWWERAMRSDAWYRDAPPWTDPDAPLPPSP